MDKVTDFAHFKAAIIAAKRDPQSTEAKQHYDNWRHYCFMNYPAGEVLRVEAETEPTPRYPRRFVTSQYC